MEVETLAILTACCCVCMAVVFFLLMSSRNNRHVWQPASPVEKEKVSPIALVEEAHTWYVSSKQESDLLQSLVRTSYGIACLRAVQNTMQLDEVHGSTLPPSVQGPAGLMAKLHSQQTVLLNALNTKSRDVPAAPELYRAPPLDVNAVAASTRPIALPDPVWLAKPAYNTPAPQIHRYEKSYKL